ncbi:hypothetical protein AB5N19_11811 [Seiridium cardinale]|uniref:F-box domain-containing protein n=1 Tax=Seiridium cardinale TaxID=138064 RepID=A0ABR2XHJ8_9PEZI
MAKPGGTAQYAPLRHLPVELLRAIVFDADLAAADIKSLRLVCKACDQIAAQRLFHRVQISRLRVHKDAFLNICSHPILAAFVRELIWYELDLEAWIPFEKDGEFSEDAQSQEVGFESIGDLMAAAAHDSELFWIPRQSPRVQSPVWSDHRSQRNAGVAQPAQPARAPQATQGVQPQAPQVPHAAAVVQTAQPDQSFQLVTGLRGLNGLVSGARAIFIPALQRLPNLTALHNCYMPASQVIPYHGYPIHADLFYASQSHRYHHGNQCFFLFLLPAMKRLRSQIRGLHFADELCQTSLTRLAADDGKAFQCLTTLELCLGSTAHDKPEEADSLVSVMIAINGLTSFKLCLEHGSKHQSAGDGILCKLLTQAKWPRLTAFELVDAFGPDLRHALLPFLRKHSASLRQLRFLHCGITMEHIMAMRKMDCLHLDAIEVLVPDTESHYLFSDTMIKAFINQESDSELLLGQYRSSKTTAQDYTESEEEDPYVPQLSKNGLLFGGDDNEEYEGMHGGSYWKLGRLGPNWNIYYWQVGDDDIDEDAYETTSWAFVHRGGRTAQGNDPLDYFSDWDSEAGDVAVSTPYGAAFNEFKSNNRPQGPPLPDGAVPYGIDEEEPWTQSHPDRFRAALLSIEHNSIQRPISPEM